MCRYTCIQCHRRVRTECCNDLNMFTCQTCEAKFRTDLVIELRLCMAHHRKEIKSAPNDRERQKIEWRTCRCRWASAQLVGAAPPTSIYYKFDENLEESIVRDEAAAADDEV